MKSMNRLMVFGVASVGLLWSSGAGAATDAENCEGEKLREAGKYGLCRLRAEMKAVLKGESPDYSKCSQRFTLNWARREGSYDGSCPTIGDTAEAEAFVTNHTQEVAAALAGAGFLSCGDLMDLCGDGLVNLDEECDGVDLGGATCASLGWQGGTLGCTPGCSYDMSGCVAPWHLFPATGQTTCWNSGGSVIPCAGTGQDGDIQAGADLSYTDNGDGTIRDNVTGLMWEKKDNNNVGGIHDKDNTYTWSQAFSVFIDRLNNRCNNDETVNCTVNGDADCVGVGGPCGFAGYRDWRLPNVKELQSIVNYEIPYPGPTVSPAFNTACAAGCTVWGCSCTQATYCNYWSSTTPVDYRYPGNAWFVDFGNGFVVYDGKDDDGHVRAVRGGE